MFRPWKSSKIKVLFGRLVTAGDKARIIQDKEEQLNNVNDMQFGGYQSLFLFNGFKKYAKTSKVLKIFKKWQLKPRS